MWFQIGILTCIKQITKSTKFKFDYWQMLWLYYLVDFFTTIMEHIYHYLLHQSLSLPLSITGWWPLVMNSVTMASDINGAQMGLTLLSSNIFTNRFHILIWWKWSIIIYWSIVIYCYISHICELMKLYCFSVI